MGTRGCLHPCTRTDTLYQHVVGLHARAVVRENSRSCRRVQVFNPEYTHEKCRALLQKFDKDRDGSIQLRSALRGPIVSGLSECADLAIVCAPIGDSGGVMVPGSGLLFSESSYRGFPGQRQRRSAHTCMCACVRVCVCVCIYVCVCVCVCVCV